MSEGRLLALTDQIYDAASGGTPWAVVGKGLTGLVRAQSASLMVGDYAAGRADLLYCSDIPMDAVVSYRKHYRSVDLWTNRAAAAVKRDGPAARPRVWISGQMVSDAEFLRSEFYVDFGRRLGLRYVVGTVVPLGAAGVMPLGLHRPDGAAPFEEAERRLLECLLPHLRRAMQLRHQLASSAPALPPGIAALDALSVGVLVVDADSQVLIANAAAEAMASANLGLLLRRPQGAGFGAKSVLSAYHHADSTALRTLIKATASGGASGGAVRVCNEFGMAALAALVAPLPRRLSDAPGGMAGRVENQALVLLRDLTAAPAAPATELLRDLFGLTRAEAEVARALSGGATKAAVAESRGIGETTVRTQVRALLTKTGASNLRDLERLLARLNGT